MASRHAILIAVFFLFLIINSGVFRAIEQNSSAQGENQVIMMTVTVWNRSGFVKGLKPESFTITDEKVVRPVEFFESSDAPVSIGILIDTSGSMDLPDLRETARPKPIAELIVHFLELSHPQNEYFLLGFNKTPKLLTDWSSGQEILSRSTDIERGQGDTAFYDACLMGIEKLQTAHFSRRALLLISDGQDNTSRHTFQDVRNRLRDSDVLLYAIGIMWPSDVGSSLGLEGQSILEELSDLTGGKTFVVKDKKREISAMAEVANELHNQYRIGFRSGLADPPNKWRRLKLEVAPPPNAPQELRKLSFRTRRGYYTRQAP
ncbi:MAG TPA: VWA domain-containing protein [Pyrinomonadaceae bacterium]|jgi:Ca-activated chloride channel family protein